MSATALPHAVVSALPPRSLVRSVRSPSVRSIAATIEAAVEGLGIANAPLWQVLSLVDRGAVELALEPFEPPRLPMHAVWPATRLLPAKTQLFIEFLAARLKKERF